MAKKLFIKTYGCQMNVYDSARMADALAPHGYARDRASGRRRSGHPQHLPHPREGGREGLFRARPPAAAAAPQAGSRRRPADRRRRLRRAGRGRGAARARALRRPRGRAADLSPPARAAPPARARRRRRARHRLSRSRASSTACPRSWRRRPASRPSSPCRRAATSSAPSASSPTRAAPRPRARPRRSWPRRGAWSPPARARSRCSARTSTPIAAPARTGEAWDLARLIRALAEIDGLLPDPLHHLASARSRRRADRGAPRGGEADAVPASAGAVRLGSRPAAR